jgi:cytochrome P450
MSTIEESLVVEYPSQLHESGETTHAGGYLALFDKWREASPVARSTLGTGFWMLTQFEDIRQAAHNSQVFSSSAVRALEPDPPYVWNPLMLDPPRHTTFRKLLTPRFAPGQVDKLDSGIRTWCAELIDRIAGKGECEFVEEFAVQFPAAVLLDLLGLPNSELATFVGWEHTVLHSTPESDPDHILAFTAMGELAVYLTGVLEERRAEPADDLISYLPQCTVDREPIADEDILNILMVLFLAGLDTTTAQISYLFYHLATHPEDRARIIADPELMPSAVEECLRFYGIVTPARKLTVDTEIAGCPMKAGEMVAIAFPSANRDEREFPNANTFDLERSPNRHFAFGAGPHRCLGSHLARREMCIALEEWHRRIPAYSLVPDATITEHGGGVLGLNELPLKWTV